MGTQDRTGGPIQAVVFDVGGVLERVSSPDAFLARWCERLGLGRAELEAALDRADPGNLMEVGRMTEAEYRQRCADALGLSSAQAGEFMRDLWDWYCGELDRELAAYAAGLRPRYRTAILSNSADGARREEQARYGFEDLVDTIVYSHEVGVAKPDPRAYALTCDRLGVRPEQAVLLDDTAAFVEAARRVGMRAVLHRSTPASIAALNALLGP